MKTNMASKRIKTEAWMC